VSISVTVGLGTAPATVNFTSSGPAPILDDAVTTSVIPVDANQTVSSVDVGIAVQHPRISDLVFHLISPDGTRILLMENRGGTSPNGAGGTAAVTTNVVADSNFEGQNAQDYGAGQMVSGPWGVTSGQVSVVNDSANAFDGSNFMALANGSISATLPTTPGQTYSLSFAYRGPGIVGWWRGENSANDSSGNNNNGMLQNGNYTSGKVGSAFALNGINADAAVPSSSSLNVGLGNGFTIEGWINPSVLNNERVIVEWDNGSTWGVHFNISTPPGTGPFGTGPGCLYANVIDANGNYHWLSTATGLVQTNVFQHAAFTYDKNSGTAKIYYNGGAVAPIYYSQLNGGFTPQTSYNMYIGRRIIDPSEASQWAGLDEISIYNRVLSSSEIQAIYQNGSAGKFDPAEFPVSPSQSLAKAGVSINGGSSMVFYGNNTSWQTTNITFTATQSTTSIQFAGMEPGMLLDAISVTTMETNYSYLTFTENTNLTTTPIKFAVPPFVSADSGPSVAGNVVWQNGFEEMGLATYYAGSYFPPGWHVDFGSINSVISGYYGAAAFEGNYFLDLNGFSDGEISTNISTVPGTTYMLNFAYSLNPDPAGASMNILINGGLLASVFASFNTYSWANLDWQTTSFVFTATSPLTSLAFQSTKTNGDPAAGNLLDAVSVTTVETNLGLYYLPEEPMTPLAGANAQGDWTLEIQDDRVGATNPAPTLLSWQLQFLFTTAGSSTGSLVNGSPQTNYLSGNNSIAYYSVTVPANADAATNLLLFAGAPLNVFFNQNAQPTGTNAGDYTLLAAATNGSVVFGANTVPPLIAGTTYWLGVQNTNNFTVNYAIAVNFHTVAGPVSISSVLASTNGVQLQWDAPSNEQFQVEWTTNLVSPIDWNTNTTGITYTNGVFTFTDPNATNEQRFYRLIQLP
jgi:subtilisin-like proprotein convertase family protein